MLFIRISVYILCTKGHLLIDISLSSSTQEIFIGPKETKMVRTQSLLSNDSVYNRGQKPSTVKMNLFIKCLLSVYCVLGNVLGTRDVTENKRWFQ